MKVRQSNFELMRILSMVFIIIYHILVHGKVLDNTNGVLHLFFILVMSFMLVHVNSFVLLAGYFNYNKDFSWKKFLKSFNQAWFYQIVIVLIAFFTGLSSFSKMDLLNNLSPFFNAYWFVFCYLCLYLLSPFLNRLINNLNQKEHKGLIILLLFLFSFMPFITKQESIANDGLTLVNFIMLYFIGSYLKKYPITENFHFKKYSKNKLQIILFLGFICFGLLHFTVYWLGVGALSFNNSLLIQIGSIFQTSFQTYSAPFVLCMSVCYFLWFSTLNIKSKVINFIASLVFGVYLIHDNRIIRNHLYYWLDINNDTLITSSFIICKNLVAVIIIFVGCIIIEFMRQKIFSFIKNRKIYMKCRDKVLNYIDGI